MPFASHNPDDDQFWGQTWDSQSLREKLGGTDTVTRSADEVGGSGYTIPGEYSQDAASDWSIDGQGYQVVGGQKQDGTSAFDRDVERARAKGAQSIGRQATQVDQTRANESLRLQLGSLASLQNAAEGGAPSRAVEMGRNATEAGMRSSAPMVAGARGPGAAVAAMGTAGQAGVARAGQIGQGVGDMRAEEMTRARGAFARGAGTMRGQDLGVATTNAQLQAEQRARDEARQQGFENRAWDTRAQQQSVGAETAGRTQQAYNDAIARQRQRKAQEEAAYIQAGADFAESVGKGLSGSDERMKTRIVPMGSLTNLNRFMYRG